jgi:hypothetical protein
VLRVRLTIFVVVDADLEVAPLHRLVERGVEPAAHDQLAARRKVDPVAVVLQLLAARPST